MRTLSGLLVSIVKVLCFSVGAGAGSRQLAVSEPGNSRGISQPEKSQRLVGGQEMYRGYFLDISAVAERKDFSALEKALQGQINMVEETNLSPRVLQFFHTVPIKVDEFACLDGAEAVTDEAPPDSEKKLKPKKPVQAWACYHESDAPGILPGNFSRGAIWDSEKSQWVSAVANEMPRTGGPSRLRSSWRGDVSSTRPRPEHSCTAS